MDLRDEILKRRVPRIARKEGLDAPDPELRSIRAGRLQHPVGGDEEEIPRVEAEFDLAEPRPPVHPSMSDCVPSRSRSRWPAGVRENTRPRGWPAAV